MISDEEYLEQDAVGLASLVAKGELAASEVLEAAIRRAEAVNPQLNAIVIPMHAQARARASEPLQGPLAGVPMLIKDLFQDYRGVPATSGSRAMRRLQHIPRQHSEVVSRFLAAGTVIFGRTNTPEFGAKGVTEPLAWGPTRNPWDLRRTPGGSSGGSAAAVAAGIVPLAGASDGGGSIRIPSSASGLFGLKPGRGRTPSGPGVGEAMHGAAMNHVLTRSVRDSAVMLDAIHGPELGSPCLLAGPERAYRDEVGRDPGKLRIAFSTRSPMGAPIDPELVEAVNETARLLESLGHGVEEAEPDIDGLQLAKDFLGIWYAQLANFMRVAASGGARWRDFEPDSRAMAEVASARTSLDYAGHYVRWNEYGYRLAEFLRRYPVFLTPTMAHRPPTIGELDPPTWITSAQSVLLSLGMGPVIRRMPGMVERFALQTISATPFTQLANVTGVPAMSVPLTTFQSGLPLGLDFLTGHGGEGLLLALAAQLEQARPWKNRRPQLDTGQSRS